MDNLANVGRTCVGNCSQCGKMTEFAWYFSSQHNGVPFTDWVCTNGLCRNHMTECECNGCQYQAQTSNLSYAKKKVKKHISYSHKNQTEPMNDVVGYEPVPLIADDDLSIDEDGECLLEEGLGHGVDPEFCLYTPHKRAKVDGSELKFTTSESQTYYDQEKKLGDQSKIKFGGIRGICWRAKENLDLYEERNISTIKDARFMLGVTKMMLEGTSTANRIMCKSVKFIVDLFGGDHMQHDIVLPTDYNTAYRTFLKGKYSIIDNIPCPPIYTKNGHAYTPIRDVLMEHLAQGRDVDFTIDPERKIDKKSAS